MTPATAAMGLGLLLGFYLGRAWEREHPEPWRSLLRWSMALYFGMALSLVLSVWVWR